MWLLKTILIVGGVIWFTNLLHAQPAASAPPEPTYSITLTTKQIMAIGALLDAAQCLISSVVQGTCDTLSTYQAMNAQITEQNKARTAAAAAAKDAPK